MDAPKAIEEIFADLMIHQVALLDGVMQGVREACSNSFRPRNRGTGGPLRCTFALDRTKARYKATWETYACAFRSTRRGEASFAHIFGTQFTEAYREYRRQRE